MLLYCVHFRPVVFVFAVNRKENNGKGERKKKVKKEKIGKEKRKTR